MTYQTVECIEANRDCLVGIKVRTYHGLTNLTPIYAALEAAEQAGVPLMFHTAPPPSIRQYLNLLRTGDIVTHLYHPKPGSVIDRKGRIRAEYREARDRGVLMDAGFARWHTDFEVMKRSVGEGFWPDLTILQRVEEDITFHDYYGPSMKGRERLVCTGLIRNGEVSSEGPQIGRYEIKQESQLR